MYRPEYLPRLTPMPTSSLFDQYHNQTHPASHVQSNPMTRTQEPIVTGTSVLAIKFKDGVMLGADTLASYGKMSRFRDARRLLPFGNNTIIGASGDLSDFQAIEQMINKLMINEYALDDQHKLYPAHIYEYLSNVMYNRRSKFDPLWNSLIVAGFQNGQSFLGYVDLKGTTYKANTIATGYGAYLAQPLLRKHVEGRENDLTEEEAKKILEESLRVLYYRDCCSSNLVQIATVTAQGAKVSDPYYLDTNWSVAKYVRGYD